MGPHSENFNDSFIFYHLIDQPVLKIDPARVRSAQISQKLFKRRRLLKRVGGQDAKKFLGFRPEPGRS